MPAEDRVQEDRGGLNPGTEQLEPLEPVLGQERPVVIDDSPTAREPFDDIDSTGDEALPPLVAKVVRVMVLWRKITPEVATIVELTLLRVGFLAWLFQHTVGCG